MPTTESILLATVHICTLRRKRVLTNASGFFYESNDQLFLVTSRHVVIDEASDHFPDHIQIALRGNPCDLTELSEFSIPLYRDGKAVWHQGTDSSGDIDVVAIELERSALPATLVYRAFTPQHLPTAREQVEVGISLLIVGFPQEPNDDFHHLPVVRQGVIASSFGLRSRSNGYFFTDSRMHRGTSGAPVVARISNPPPALGDLPWMLLGVHSSRAGATSVVREPAEVLGLNRAWYADVFMPTSEDFSRSAA